MIQEKNLEDYDFCITDRQDGTLKSGANDIIIWGNAMDNHAQGNCNSKELEQITKVYGTNYTTDNLYGNGGKVAILIKK
jgi:hypothetical protein